MEVEGFVVVDSPGNYSLAAESDDRFIVWLDDKWLMMRQAGDAGDSMGLPAAAWLADVCFQSAGEWSAQGECGLRCCLCVPVLSTLDSNPTWCPLQQQQQQHM